MRSLSRGILFLIIFTLLGCGDKSENPSPEPDPDPPAVITLETVAETQLNYLKISLPDSTITIVGADPRNEFYSVFSFKKTIGGANFKLIFSNADLSEINSTINDAFLGRHPKWETFGMIIKRADTDIVAKSKDGKSVAKSIKWVKNFGDSHFHGFQNSEQISAFWKNLIDPNSKFEFTDVSGSNFKFKINYADWLLNK